MRGEMCKIGKENKEPEEEKQQDVDRQALTVNGGVGKLPTVSDGIF